MSSIPLMEDAADPKLEVETYGQRSSNMWLVKVPKYLGERWLEHAKTNRHIGKIDITKTLVPNKTNNRLKRNLPTPANQKYINVMTYTASEELLNSQPAPKKQVLSNGQARPQVVPLSRPGMAPMIPPNPHGTLPRTKIPQPPVRQMQQVGMAQSNQPKIESRMEKTYVMKQLDTRESLNNALQVVFTESKTRPPLHQGENRQLRGKVSKFYDLDPKKTTDYFRYKRDLHNQNSMPTKITQKYDNNIVENRYQAGSVATFNVKSTQEKEDKLKKRANQVDMSKQDIERKLFELFNKHEYCMLDDIVKFVGQSKNKVTDALNDIAIYNTGHPHKNHWELKPDYKDYS